jgi:hypothetical protein
MADEKSRDRFPSPGSVEDAHLQVIDRTPLRSSRAMLGAPENAAAFIKAATFRFERLPPTAADR